MERVAPTNRRSTDRDYVVLISFDGLRHDYLDRVDTPGFDRLAATGAVADALIPVFPSLTFPSHYSIATGMYPASHGIVGNQFYDPARDEPSTIEIRTTHRTARGGLANRSS